MRVPPGFASVEPLTYSAIRFVISSPTCLAVGKPESCEGLDIINNNIAVSTVLQCQRSDDCLSLDCDGIQTEDYGAVLYLLPCDRPPAIELFSKTPLGNSSEGKFDSSDQTRTAVIDLGSGTVFWMTMSWITAQTVSLSVRFTM